MRLTTGWCLDTGGCSVGERWMCDVIGGGHLKKGVVMTGMQVCMAHKLVNSIKWLFVDVAPPALHPLLFFLLPMQVLEQQSQGGKNSV